MEAPSATDKSWGVMVGCATCRDELAKRGTFHCIPRIGMRKLVPRAIWEDLPALHLLLQCITLQMRMILVKIWDTGLVVPSIGA